MMGTLPFERRDWQVVLTWDYDTRMRYMHAAQAENARLRDLFRARLYYALTPVRLRMWLEQQPPDARVGSARVERACPIARFAMDMLRPLAAEHGVESWQLGVRVHDASIGGPFGGEIATPGWVERALRLVDATEGEVTAARMLALLDQVQADA